MAIDAENFAQASDPGGRQALVQGRDQQEERSHISTAAKKADGGGRQTASATVAGAAQTIALIPVGRPAVGLAVVVAPMQGRPAKRAKALLRFFEHFEIVFFEQLEYLFVRQLFLAPIFPFLFHT